MKKLILTALIAFSANMATATCIGDDTLRSCTDNSGNTYNIMRLGDTTYVDGSNYRTGSRWSSEHTTYGDTTYTTGRAANGNTWNATTTNLGGMRYTTGTDANGNHFSSSCNEYGCF